MGRLSFVSPVKRDPRTLRESLAEVCGKGSQPLGREPTPLEVRLVGDVSEADGWQTSPPGVE